MGRLSHQWGGNWKEDLVRDVFVAICPENLKHGLHRVCDVVLVVRGMALQFIAV